MANQLNVMMRKSQLHLNAYGRRVHDDDLLPLPPGHKYDIMCHHIRFNYKTISEYFPNDTLYVAMIREPFDQFISAFKYYTQVFKRKTLLKAIEFNPENPVEGFLNNTQLNMASDPRRTFVDNRMIVDLGIPMRRFQAYKRQKNILENFLKKIESIFDVILIFEMFDESLILLRRILGWTTKDIIYINKNVFLTENNEQAWVNKKNYSSRVHEMFQKFEVLDIALYKKFLNLFQKRLKSQPPDFFVEVEQFKEVKRKISRFCEESVKDSNELDAIQFPTTNYTHNFNVTRNDCAIMNLNETEITDVAKSVQMKRYQYQYRMNDSFE